MSVVMREMDPSCLGSVELVSLRLGLVLAAFGDVVKVLGRMWWYTPLILAQWGPRQTLEASLVYIVSPCLRIRRSKQRPPRQQGKTDGLDKFYSSRIYLKEFLRYLQDDLCLRKLIIDSRRN